MFSSGTKKKEGAIKVAKLRSKETTTLNARKTWEELQRIKAMPIPMAQKKILKAQLSKLPKFQLEGRSHVRYMWQRYKENFHLKLTYIKRNLIFLNSSLRAVELRVGTAIANVFLLIKWTMFLNIAISLCMLSFVIGPYLTYELLQEGNQTRNSADPDTCNNTDEGIHLNLTDESVRGRHLDCCQARYYKHLTNTKGDIKKYTGYEIDKWPIYIGYYTEPYISFNGSTMRYSFSTAYVLTGFAILACCLILVVHNIAAGVKEVIRLKEGELYKYSNLVFSGWEHFTNDPIGANFKRKMLREEMKQILRLEKKKITHLGKTKREHLKVIFLRGFVHLTVLVLLFGAGYTIFSMSLSFKRAGTNNVQASTNTSNSTEADDKVFGLIPGEFAVSLVISFFNLIFPIILTRLGKLENHSREVEIALVLLRSLFIRIFSIYALAGVYYKETYCRPLAGHCTKCNTSNATDSSLNPGEKARQPCWESEFGSQMYKLIITELGIKVLLTFIVDPLRRYVGSCCKNKFGAKIGRLNFNIVRHSLDIIYIQLLTWLSFYFAPFMPLATVAYCFLIFYVKKFGVMNNVNYVPDAFRTTRTTAVFMVAKIISFVIILFTFAFVVAYMVPSRGCGPFRGRSTAWSAVKDEFKQYDWINAFVNTFFPGVAIPVALVLMLLAYYYFSVARANRSTVETLRHLLILEGHDKQYLFTKLNSLRLADPPEEPPPIKIPDIDTTIFRDPTLNRRLSIISNRMTRHMPSTDKTSKTGDLN